MNDRYEFRVTQEELVLNYIAIATAGALYKAVSDATDQDIAIMSMVEMITMCTWDLQNDCRVDSNYGYEIIAAGLEAILEASEAFVKWLHEEFDEDERLRPFKEFLDDLR